MSHGHHLELALLDAETAERVAAALHALSTPSRVRILSRLAMGACGVGELADAVEMSQPAVSQQLRVLRYLGMVVGAREGRRVIYELHDEHVVSLLTEAVAHTEHLRLGDHAHPAVAGRPVVTVAR